MCTYDTIREDAMSNCEVKAYLLPQDIYGSFEVDDEFKKLPLVSQLDLLNKWNFQIQSRYRHTLMLFCFEIFGGFGSARSWEEKLIMFSALAKSLDLELPYDFRELARKHLAVPIVCDHVSCEACRALKR